MEKSWRWPAPRDGTTCSVAGCTTPSADRSATVPGWTRRLAIEGTLRIKGGAVIEVESLYAGLPG
jgi:hypothetical protein